ncbi:conjugal transfer protein TraF [Halorhodospira halochloris]|uniref:conjugal transfer protein TraF n=1 Tax=Halorhodospira halochloris TaxID=1052 RepID=UPI001EE9A751|nr:conjugal transfer protein TraF [Halorhodospira halochloris]MCG5548177.1 conjugal transfer protein TraF [Halorhodospira halochloris]
MRDRDAQQDSKPALLGSAANTALLTGWAMLALGGATLAGTAMASPTAGMSSGSSLTLGNVSHPHARDTSINPAASPIGPAFSTSILRVGAGAELGPVDDLIDELDELQDDLDGDFNTIADAEDARDKANDFLVQAGEDGYAKLSAFGHVPITPLSMQLPWGDGGISLDVRFTGLARLGILDAPVNAYSDDGEFGIETDTSLYIKGAVLREITFGYGHNVWQGERSELLLGFSLTHYQSDLSKIVIPLQDADDVGDTITDEYDADQKQDSDFGVGLGLLWNSDYYRFGIVGRNLNQPELEFGAIGQSCHELSGDAQERCKMAQQFGDRIDLEETWTLDPQMSLEAAVYNEDQSWVLAASYDTNSVKDPVGDDQQWFAVSVSTVPQARMMPEWRFGYRENMAGSELTYVTTGFTLFRSFSLDIAYGLENVTHTSDDDEQDYPRSVKFNVGLDLAF